MEQFLDQRPENISAQAKLVAENIERSMRAGAGYPVIDGGPSDDFAFKRRTAHEHWGPMRIFADRLLYRVFGRGLRDPIIDRRRD